jgi:dihydropyrimidinase
LLDDSVYDREGVEGALPVCAPPIRPKGEQSKMWQALADEHLQIVTTDHCPFTREEKASGLANFSTIPGGVPSIESRFTLLYSYGVNAGHFSENRWVDMACTTPAKLAGFTDKGHIAVGYDADLVVFDPQKSMTISAQTLHEKAGWTPYDGVDVTGLPLVTLSRGKILVDDGEFLGTAGQGKFVKRQLAT